MWKQSSFCNWVMISWFDSIALDLLIHKQKSMISVRTLIISYLGKAFHCVYLDLLIRQKSIISVRTLTFPYLRKMLDWTPLDWLIHKKEVYGFSRNYNVFVPSQGVWLYISWLINKTKVYGFSKNSIIFVPSQRRLIAYLLIYCYTRQKSMVSVRTSIYLFLHKPFDCISLYLLIQKTKVYSFSKNSNIFVPLKRVWLHVCWFTDTQYKSLWFQ